MTPSMATNPLAALTSIIYHPLYIFLLLFYMYVLKKGSEIEMWDKVRYLKIVF